MITETKTERGRTVLKVETEQEFQRAFGRMDLNHTIDAPQEILENNGIFDSAEELVLLGETDWRGISAFPQGSMW